MPQVYKLEPSFSKEAKNLTIDYEKELNHEQLPIVKAEDGPILVIAGAGSGKTRTVTYRVAYLVESGVPLRNILLVTFTNKAAKEMKYRVEGLLKRSLQGLWAGTFHHVGNLILRKHAKKLGYSKNFTIMDRGDSKDLIARSTKEAGINIKEKKFPKADVIQDVYSYMVNSRKELHTVIAEKHPTLFEMQGEIKHVLDIYEQTKKTQSLMDFDDLLSKWLELLLEFPEVLEEYAGRFNYILVDEYQDTNLVQAQVIDLLASKHKNLMVVGDDSQSIYKFRAAEYKNIIEFPGRYNNCKVFKIETNYRSTPEILSFANESIKNAEEKFEKNLRPVRKKGVNPIVVSFRDVHQQATFVAQRILEQYNEGMPMNEMAIIYRSHYHCLELQMELTRRGIPYELRSGLRLFEEAHIKDVMSYLKIFHNPQDGLSWYRILKLLPNVGQKTAEKIWRSIQKSEDPVGEIIKPTTASLVTRGGQDSFKQLQLLLKVLAGQQGSPSSMMETILDNGYSDYLQMTYANHSMRADELRELSNYASEYESLEKFLSAMVLVGGTKAEEITAGGSTEKEAVVLTTVHQAKGLEWRVVFIVWLADGRFPSYRSFDKKEDLEEERRLFYVAVTRSKDQLYLAYPITYQSREGNIVLKASRFLKEVSEHRYEKWLIEDELGLSDDDVETWD
ncbi:MAG: ATP-dependent helicase [Candidatus Saganbacteria bacterium]|nr:ATP-dependent helicase [Candidatus Saganbacteria bacterium]